MARNLAKESIEARKRMGDQSIKEEVKPQETTPKEIIKEIEVTQEQKILRELTILNYNLSLLYDLCYEGFTQVGVDFEKTKEEKESKE